MTIHTRELRAQHEHYQKIRATLWGKPAPNISLKPALVIEEKIAKIEVAIAKEEKAKPNLGDKPLWKWVNLHFDKHVIEFYNRPRFSPDEVQRRDLNAMAGGLFRRSALSIVEETLRNFPGVTWEMVKGHRRMRHIVEARHACMYAVYRERQDVSFPFMGRLFGNRDHTTILSAIKKMEAREKGKYTARTKRDK